MTLHHRGDPARLHAPHQHRRRSPKSTSKTSRSILGHINGQVEGSTPVTTWSGLQPGGRGAQGGVPRHQQGPLPIRLEVPVLSGLMQPIMKFVGNLGYVAVAMSGAVLAVTGPSRWAISSPLFNTSATSPSPSPRWPRCPICSSPWLPPPSGYLSSWRRRRRTMTCENPVSLRIAGGRGV